MPVAVWQDALRHAEKAIRIDPSFARGYMRKGNALESKGIGRLNEAMAAYKKGLQIDPKDTGLGNAVQNLEATINHPVSPVASSCSQNAHVITGEAGQGSGSEKSREQGGGGGRNQR